MQLFYINKYIIMLSSDIFTGCDLHCLGKCELLECGLCDLIRVNCWSVADVLDRTWEN